MTCQCCQSETSIVYRLLRTGENGCFDYCPNCRHMTLKSPGNVDYTSDYHNVYHHGYTSEYVKGLGLARKRVKRLGNIKGLRVLDVGCSAGSLLSELEKNGAIAVGVEPDTSYREFNQLKGRTVYSDTREVPGTFDIVVSYHTIEHVDNVREFISLLYGKLVVGGKLVIVVPNAGEMNDDYAYHRAHRQYFTTYSLMHLLKTINVHATVESGLVYMADRKLSKYPAYRLARPIMVSPLWVLDRLQIQWTISLLGIGDILTANYTKKPIKESYL